MNPAGPTVRVDDSGVEVSGTPEAGDLVLDLLLEGRRIWSFRAAAAADDLGTAAVTPDGGSRWTVAWPPALCDLVRGSGVVAVRGPQQVVLAEAEVRFSDDDVRAAFVGRDGAPLVLDAKARITRSLADDDAGRSALLQAARRVLDTMREAGLEGFLAYGTLLGAIREGTFIGHDDDVDLAYISRRTHPTEVALESLHLQRVLTRAGMTIERYSGAGIKVIVVDDTGATRWLDVFGGFWHGDRLALLGEIHAPFRREWITPLGSAELAGESFPVPAAPERLLELMYGPDWQMPDPTFSFDSDAEGRIELGRWFRGIREQRNGWERWYSGASSQQPFLKPHHISRVVHDHEDPAATVFDVGLGRGQDAAWLAEMGHPTIGLDYSLSGADHHRQRAAENGWPLTVQQLNFLDLRQVLAYGARYAREIDGPRVVVARHFLNATSVRCWEGFFRFSSMVLRGGGRMYLEFFVEDGAHEVDPGDLVWRIPAEEVVAAIEAAGGRVERTIDFDPNWFELPWRTGAWDPKPHGRRIVARWP